MSEDLFIRKIYTYKGVHIVVEIDLVKKTLTLVEKQYDDSFKPKKWLFASRQHAYMPSWLLILEAMQNAIIKGAEVLAQAEARNEKKFMERLIASSEIFDQNPEPKGKSKK